MLQDTFDAIMKNVKPDSDPQKAMKKVLIRTFGDRDFSAQETMHLLLSLKLNNTSFQALPVNLNGSRRVEVNVVDLDICTKNSLLDVYANRMKFKNVFPGIMSVNFVDFVTNYTLKKNSLVKQTGNVVPRIFPNYSSNPKGENYALFCKYQLLQYKPWKDSQQDAWGSNDTSESTLIIAWHDFLKTPLSKKHVPQWVERFQNVLSCIEFSSNQHEENEQGTQEEWMILSDYHNSNSPSNSQNMAQNSCNWQLDSTKYTEQQIGEMPNWIKIKKDHPIPDNRLCNQIDTNS